MAIQKTKLSVNLNKVALLRNARQLDIPNLERAAKIVLNDTDATGITLHPRPDERHIRYDDVYSLTDVLCEYNQTASIRKELNLEGNPFHGKYLELALAILPDQCTLVPDAPNQSTSSYGWRDKRHLALLLPIIARLKKHKIRVSIFADPDLNNLQHIMAVHPDAIELYTEPFARQHLILKSLIKKMNPTYESQATDHSFVVPNEMKKQKEYMDWKNSLAIYQRCAEVIYENSILVNAGHDFNLENLSSFLQCVKNIHEVSIGHALVADAIFYGLQTTINKYIKLIG